MEMSFVFNCVCNFTMHAPTVMNFGFLINVDFDEDIAVVEVFFFFF